ncbi:hypothetical protein BDV32DRAFT_148096 [Aspergillus pseudonomiae]|uniref:Uncharacterized protein n=1 Tax=Aspergillus pseudonomiae TaxID=1506151 RepID=A0A5N6I527_9EURO|nr:uncharacterized protein BDV37DRAFT_283858 [Aspergillus pseudonomiae]KAB8261772.1 hypothetical protein BDV32DRAFT_148096 [Aspergillus pseudonomiae]KAE8403250.1 hypothetical protein BDV37DRAFT_283858 [Aspergillus pseudonomiae]
MGDILPGTYVLVHQATQQALDLSRSSGQLIGYERNGSKQQTWTVESGEEPDTYTIRSAGEVGQETQYIGSQIPLPFPVYESDAVRNTFWKATPVGPDTYKFENDLDKRVLSLYGTENEKPITLDFDPQRPQGWVLYPAEN